MPPQGPPLPVWEYKVAILLLAATADLEAWLNAFGLDSWELVTRSQEGIYIFKREVN